MEKKKQNTLEENMDKGHGEQDEETIMIFTLAFHGMMS